MNLQDGFSSQQGESDYSGIFCISELPLNAAILVPAGTLAAFQKSSRWVDLACLEMRRLAASLPREVFPILKTGRSRGRVPFRQSQQLAIYLAHVSLGISYNQLSIGFTLDRTTIRYSCHRIEDCRDDPVFDALVVELELTSGHWAHQFLKQHQGSSTHG